MKRFIINTLIFILPLFTMVYFVDIYFSQKLKKTAKCNGEFEVWNDIYDGNITCDLAIYGSSRAWVHINPEILNDSLALSTYNFGIDGHNFWLQYLRHLEYLKHNRTPKVIVHSVDLFTLHGKDKLYNMHQFLPYMLWNYTMYKYTSGYEGYSVSDFLVPLLRYRHFNSGFKFLISKNEKKDQPYRKEGFKAMEREWNTDLENAKKKNKQFTVVLDSTTIQLYEHFLKECKAGSIEVILVYTPEYIEGQLYVANRNEVLDIFKSLAAKYEFTFLDYSDNYLCFDRHYFYNATHMNSKGSEIFSGILSHDLKATGKTTIHKNGVIP